MPQLSRHALRAVVAWVAAAVVAVAVASWGVALVGRSVTDDRPAPLSAQQVEERLATTTSSTSTTAVVTTDPATTAVPPEAGEPGPTSSAPPPTAAAGGETRTYSLVGGTASLRFEPSGVSVVFANPAPGFEVEVEPEAGGVRVEFESERHRSRLTGWWDGGPQDRVEERAEDDD